MLRSLRVKAQLLYPVDIDLEKELSNVLEKAQFDEKTQSITLIIEDPSLQNMVKNEIELAYGTVNLTLNPKHLTLPVEGFILLLSRMKMDQEDAIDRLNDAWRKNSKNVEDITKEKLIKRIWNKKESAATIATLVTAGIEAWPHLGNILNRLLSLIK